MPTRRQLTGRERFTSEVEGTKYVAVPAFGCCLAKAASKVLI
jgi:hypothetical protein